MVQFKDCSNGDESFGKALLTSYPTVALRTRRHALRMILAATKPASVSPAKISQLYFDPMNE